METGLGTARLSWRQARRLPGGSATPGAGARQAVRGARRPERRLRWHGPCGGAAACPMFLPRNQLLTLGRVRDHPLDAEAKVRVRTDGRVRDSAKRGHGPAATTRPRVLHRAPGDVCVHPVGDDGIGRVPAALTSGWEGAHGLLNMSRNSAGGPGRSVRTLGPGQRFPALQPLPVPRKEASAQFVEALCGEASSLSSSNYKAAGSPQITVVVAATAQGRHCTLPSSNEAPPS